MLDQMPDTPDPRGDRDVEDAVFVDIVNPSAGDGVSLGKFRAGMTAKPGGRPPKPLWRRIAMFFLRWIAILIVVLALTSAIVAFAFAFLAPPPTITMASRAMAGMTVQRTWVPLSSISLNLVRAVMADEDQRFCSHQGFDLVEIQKALDAEEAGEKLRGASTISQQTAKNVFLFQGGGWARKGAEAWFTFLIEKEWTKNRIMEVYLNVAEWGDGIFGAEAAARARFGVSAKNLTPEQAARLAAVLPNPNVWKVDGKYAVNRRGPWILRNMQNIARDGLDACLLGKK
jgi:monofunctional biosynthetic peptidoglycan transglycosylase